MAKRKLSGLEKAAIFIAAVGPEAAAEILKQMDIKEVGIISSLISQIGDVNAEEIDEVMGEFSVVYKATRGLPRMGEKYMREILEKSLGKEQADQIFESMNDQEGANLQSLKWMDPKSIANLIRNEHPQTIALILNYLNPNQTAIVLSFLSETLKADVVFRMATLEDISPQVLRDLEEVIVTQIQMMGGSLTSLGVSRIEKTANLLNEMDRSTSEAILDFIGKNDQTVAEQIRALMFVFDDLVMVDNRGIQAILQSVSRDILTKAMRGAGNAVKDKILLNMSSRAQTALKEDIEAMGGIPLKEVESAQGEILKTVRRLEGEGKLVILGRGGEQIV